MPLCDHLLHSPAGRALQMNRGAGEASGDYLFFLHADSLPGVSAARLAAYLERRPLWGFCRVRLSGIAWSLRVISRFINWRSRLTASRQPATRCSLSARSCLRRFGGFDEIPLMEDVA